MGKHRYLELRNVKDTPWLRFDRGPALNWLVKMSLVLLTMLATGAISAQTDFQIQAESADLEAEYQKELDKWMLNAYEGDKDAQFKVGVLFSNSQFGEPDHEQASYWYKQAARQGHVLAQYNLGHQYLTGTGVKRDEKTAMQWWLKAAEQQHPLAQFNVGRAYYMGIGLEKDLSQAKLWFQRASQNKEPKSTELLKQLGWWDSVEVANAPPPTPSQDTPASDADDTELALQTRPIATQASLNDGSAKASVASSAADQTEENDGPLTSAAPEPDNDGAALANQQVDDSAITEQAAAEQAVAVFTNPAVRSVLITIVNDATQLSVMEEGPSWTVVQDNRGLPVWVSKNFVRESAGVGTITASSVNARSVPLLTQGSVVGRLNKNEKLTILDERGDWYRLLAPKRFKAWVKSSVLAIARPQNTQPTNSQVTQISTEERRLAMQNIANNLGLSLDDNDWLFKQDEQQYALQLASFKTPELVQRFIESLPSESTDDIRLFTTRSSEGGHWTYLVYGQFPDSDSAKLARTELKQKRAWVRRIGMLQQNRCLAWKRELPAPKELNQFCI